MVVKLTIAAITKAELKGLIKQKEMGVDDYEWSQVSGITLIEEGRRQRAEGRRNNWRGIQTPTNCEHRVDGGVLDP